MRVDPLTTECPAIHPRCRWGAAPYKGRPTPLQLPLGFLYVHHTYVPASPCTTFARCAANMRSMQRFHQDTQGWDDIGYRWAGPGSSGAGPQGKSRVSGAGPVNRGDGPACGGWGPRKEAWSILGAGP
jgi:hypothetical protein